MRACYRHQQRTGSVLVFAAFMMVVMFGLVAFAVDIGYVSVVHSQMQSAADATALAATWELVGQRVTSETTPVSDCSLLYHTRSIANEYARLNPVANSASTLGTSDVVIGRVNDVNDIGGSWNFDDPSNYNAVKIRVRRTNERNGEVSLFFARAMGIDSTSAQSEATAMFLDNIAGFSASSSDPNDNVQILPFALDKATWDNRAASGSDDWTWNEDDQSIHEGGDTVPEVNLFPQGIDLPGNRGTVDIGSSNNSTADIARQIVEGVSAADLEYHGGVLQLNESGQLDLNGDTGISAGVKDELESIKGQPRIIPLFDHVVGPGNNAVYTIVGFAGVRILDVKLTGSMSSKRVIVQKAKIFCKGVTPAPQGTQVSDSIYSPVWLVR